MTSGRWVNERNEAPKLASRMLATRADAGEIVRIAIADSFEQFSEGYKFWEIITQNNFEILNTDEIQTYEYKSSIIEHEIRRINSVFGQPKDSVDWSTK